MKPPTVLHHLTLIQRQYLNDFKHRFFVVPPGRRSRKTLLGEAKLRYIAGSIPDLNCFMAAPTYDQAKRIYWDRAVNDFAPITKATNGTSLIITLQNDSKIFLFGLDKPQRMEGSPWDYGLITETGNTKPDFWHQHIEPCFSDTVRKVRIDDKTNGIDFIQLGGCLFDGVPEGRNHYYNMALYACNGVIPRTQPLIGGYAENDEWAYYHWFSADVLSAKEIQSKRESMDERTFRQEYEGEFVSYEGTLYYNFSQANINDGMTKVNPDLPLYLSCDFNKTPLCWGVGQKRGRSAIVCDEIVIPYNGLTERAAVQFCERYKGNNNKLVYLTGDASGNITNTRDFSTDYLIIEQALKQNKFQVVFRVPDANPSINNRINLVCSLFKSLTGEIRCFINSKCVYLQNDLNRNVSDGHGGKDKSDPQQTHSSDWLDYMLCAMYEGDMWGQKVGQARIR